MYLIKTKAHTRLGDTFPGLITSICCSNGRKQPSIRNKSVPGAIIHSSVFMAVEKRSVGWPVSLMRPCRGVEGLEVTLCSNGMEAVQRKYDRSSLRRPVATLTKEWLCATVKRYAHAGIDILSRIFNPSVRGRNSSDRLRLSRI